MANSEERDLMRVGIVGATGFLGGELVRLLAAHPKVEIAALCAHSNVDVPLAKVRPSLAAAGDLMLEAFDADSLANSCDLVFLALPHGSSAIAARQLLEGGVRCIDLGSDFRLRMAADYPRWYGREAGWDELPAGAIYSLPELTGALPDSTKLIANPGCFATALALAITPLSPHLRVGTRLRVFGVTGSTGSGAKPTDKVHHSLRGTNFSAYKSLRHQHMGEVLQLLAGRSDHLPEIAFVPHSAPMARGIHLTLLIDRADLQLDPMDLLADAYQKSPLVRVVEGELNMGQVIGSAGAVLGRVHDSSTWVVFAAIDNLLKGGSGQAVQNMNLWMGWDECLGLPRMGMWP